MKKLIINSSSVTENDGKAKLTYDLSYDDGSQKKDFSLFFETDSSYKDYFSYEVCDPVVAQLVTFAIRKGFDFESNLPISNSLYFKLTMQLMPVLCAANNIKKIPEIIAERKDFNWHPTEVATANSMGVDSLTTIKEFTSPDTDEAHKLTMLTYFEVGAHHLGGTMDFNKREETFLGQMKLFEDFCDEYGFKKLVVRTNFVELPIAFWEHDSFDRTHTFRNLGLVLAFQKLIKTYYYSTGSTTLNSLDINSLCVEYDPLTLPNLSTNNTSFYSTGMKMDRLEKIKYLSDYAPAQKYLLVCYYNPDSNCGRCMKCKRTQLELDLLGELDKYKNRFDLHFYKKNRQELLDWLFADYYVDEHKKVVCDAYINSGYKPSIRIKLASIKRKIKSKK